jgi:four helix bundle protein
VRDFRRFDVWWESIALGQSIYQLTRRFPREERYGLTSQMRSAVVSISSNIAEGAGRGSRNELARFLRIAIGSTRELDSQIHLSIELGILERDSPIPGETDRLRRRPVRLVDRVEA